MTDIHSQSDQSNIRHGTDSAYQYHRCRCRSCRDAHAEYHRQYRAARRALKQAAIAAREHAAMDAIARLR